MMPWLQIKITDDATVGPIGGIDIADNGGRLVELCDRHSTNTKGVFHSQKYS